MLIRIRDTTQAGVLIDIESITNPIESILSKYQWSLIDIDGAGSLPDGEGIISFSKRVREKPGSLIYDWKNLIYLLNSLTQIHDLELKTNSNSIESICCFDSTYWEIEANDEQVIEIMKKHFQKIETLNGEKPYPS